MKVAVSEDKAIRDNKLLSKTKELTLVDLWLDKKIKNFLKKNHTRVHDLIWFSSFYIQLTLLFEGDTTQVFQHLLICLRHLPG